MSEELRHAIDCAAATMLYALQVGARDGQAPDETLKRIACRAVYDGEYGTESAMPRALFHNYTFPGAGDDQWNAIAHLLDK